VAVLVDVVGRVVDETGAGIEGARVEFRPADGGSPVPVSSDPAGNFRANLAADGEYAIRAERQGFYLYQGSQSFAAGPSQLTVTLNHVQEFSEKVDVTASPPPIDPQQPSDHKELVNAEIQAIPGSRFAGLSQYPGPAWMAWCSITPAIPISTAARPIRPTTRSTGSTCPIPSPANWKRA
jgi:hypothetical protein